MKDPLRTGFALGVLLCLPVMPVAGQDEASPLARLKALRAERLSALPQAAAPTAPAKTVVVDCAKGGRISAALAANQGPLLIKLRGICQENVRVERSDVTIRGQDPATDGVRGVTANPQPAALEFYHANRTSLENISVSDGPGRGIGAWYSDLTVTNCRIERNGSTGMHISASSYLLGTGLVVSRNSATGIFSYRGSLAQCSDCRLEDNGGFAGAARLGGFLTLAGEISGKNGISASLHGGSYIEFWCEEALASPCSINVDQVAVSAMEGGTATLYGVGPFSGQVDAGSGGRVGIWGGEQSLPSGRTNNLWESAWLYTGATENGEGTTLAATWLDGFSRALLEATELKGTLQCDRGADAWSDTPPGQVIGCESTATSP